MKKIIALASASTILAACGAAVTVDFPAPNISNVQNQSTYCTMRSTNVDFALNFSGSLTRVQVFLVPQGTELTAGNVSNYTAFEATSSTPLFNFGTGKVSGVVTVNLQGTQPSNVATTQSIIVNPATTYRVWVRGFSASGNATGFVAGQLIAPSTDSQTCDPNVTFS